MSRNYPRGTSPTSPLGVSPPPGHVHHHANLAKPRTLVLHSAQVHPPIANLAAADQRADRIADQTAPAQRRSADCSQLLPRQCWRAGMTAQRSNAHTTTNRRDRQGRADRMGSDRAAGAGQGQRRTDTPRLRGRAAATRQCIRGRRPHRSTPVHPVCLASCRQRNTGGGGPQVAQPPRPCRIPPAALSTLKRP